MFGRKSLMGILGVAALLAGMMIFISGNQVATHWGRWFFGPLLWFVGCALMISWVMAIAYSAGKKTRGAGRAEEGEEKQSSGKAARRAG